MGELFKYIDIDQGCVHDSIYTETGTLTFEISIFALDDTPKAILTRKKENACASGVPISPFYIAVLRIDEHLIPETTSSRPRVRVTALKHISVFLINRFDLRIN